jgi:hypothetical protein
MSTVLTSFA